MTQSLQNGTVDAFPLTRDFLDTSHEYNFQILLHHNPFSFMLIGTLTYKFSLLGISYFGYRDEVGYRSLKHVGVDKIIPSTWRYLEGQRH